MFIVLEGIDGAGTTTQTGRLVRHLRGAGRKAAATCEPSSGPVGRLLREMLSGAYAAASGKPVNGQTMALLFAADRLDHLQREIEPLLAAGSDVVSDRYLMSSLAYQAEEADQVWVLGLARGIRIPDLTILIDLPVEVAARRRKKAARPNERYDADAFLRKVAGNYLALAKKDPSAVIVAGDQAPDDVERAIAAIVDKKMGR